MLTAYGFMRAVRSWRQFDWVRLYCRGMSLFALQGAVVLALYALRGWDTPPAALPLGLQLDPLHGVIHLLTGLAGAAFGFLRPMGAMLFLRLFTVFYLGLAVFGTFTHVNFGMQLQLPENALHWFLGSLAALIAFGPNVLAALRGPQRRA